MVAVKKREIEHQFLARIDNTPEGDRPGLWDRIVAYCEEKGISRNDAINSLLEAGAKRKGL